MAEDFLKAGSNANVVLMEKILGLFRASADEGIVPRLNKMRALEYSL